MKKDLEQPTQKAQMAFLKWVAYCIEIKFCDKSDIDKLEKIWWEYHDFRGNVISSPIKEPIKQ